MTKRRLGVMTVKTSLAVFLAALSGAVSAVDIGHARVVSASSEPLRISVQLRNVDDFSALKASMAPLASWANYALTPPPEMSSLKVELDPKTSRLLIQSEHPSDSKIIDLLFDVSSPSGVQRHQVSVLNASALSSVSIPSQAQDESPSIAGPVSTNQQSDRSQPDSSDGSMMVKRGDTLSAIARRNASAEYTDYQYIAALHALNESRFTHGNINFIQAGAQLKQPSLDQILQHSDRDARRFFVQQGQWFTQYKSLLAAGNAPSFAAEQATQGITTSSQASSLTIEPQEDRLELANVATDGTSFSADQAVSNAEALAHTTQQVSQLEENLSHLSRALHEQGEAAKDALLDGAKELGVDLGSLSTSNSTTNQANGADSSINKLAAASNASVASPTTAGKTVSWIQEHMLMVMSLLLVLLVVLTVWILRRANSSRGDIDSPAPVSSDMVREKLEKINLDLDVPPSDEPPKSS